MSASQMSNPHSQGKRQAPEASVHMSVLGMDGNDHEIGVMATSLPSNAGPTTALEEGIYDNGQRTAQESLLRTGCESRPASPGKARNPSTGSPSGSPANRGSRNSNGHSAESMDTAPAASDKAYWWGKVLWGKAADGNEDDEEDESAQYQSLEAPEVNNSRASFSKRLLVRSKNLSPSSLVDTLSSATGASVEERLKKDCSFFYQGIEDPATGSPKKQKKTRGLSSTVHQQMPRLLSSRDGARFHAQYERLNQDVVLVDTDELILDEYQSTFRASGRQASASSDVIDFSSTATTSQNTLKTSSLFFEQDGRLLMKLPRDQVRLIMDQDLEPGIIAVEKWRKVDKNSFNPVGPSVANDNAMMMILEDGGGGSEDLMGDITGNGKLPSSQPPPLRYVMTVPDDLYRRVVAEMSYALLPPCWGFFKCCSDGDGKADIKLALAILGVILFLMFIITMEWPTDR